jgi:excisionase family DNA binding protein
MTSGMDRSRPDEPRAPASSGHPLTLQLADVCVTLPAETVDALVAILARRLPTAAPRDASPFLTVGEAAAYLRSSRQRVYDLLSSRRLTRHKDGARVLISRAELDTYLGGHP